MNYKFEQNIRVAREWDKLSPIRSALISGRQDIAFEHLIQPAVLDFIRRHKPDSVFDGGCGTGELTHEIAKLTHRVRALDVSSEAIRIASIRQTPNTVFETGEIEAAPELLKEETFDAFVSSMVLMDAPNYLGVIEAYRQMIGAGGWGLFLFLHPVWYPIHRQLNLKQAYDYWHVDDFQLNYKITKKATRTPQTYYHRPLERYVNAFVRFGFEITGMCEPAPAAGIRTDYLQFFKYPRLVGFEVRAV